MSVEYKSLGLARIKCRAMSIRYLTSWYVRKMESGNYSLYAHDSHDDKTVACFYCGDDWSNIK